MVFDYRADGRCCTKMLSQPNLRSCSLRLRQAERGRRRTRGKRNTGERGGKRIKASKQERHKRINSKNEHQSKKSESSEARTKARKRAEQRAGVVESTTEVMSREQQNDAETTRNLKNRCIFFNNLQTYKQIKWANTKVCGNNFIIIFHHNHICTFIMFIILHVTCLNS